jgi:cytochrome c biogenesis protein CcmG/thiol:disulfide interchange protein DsbE
MSTATHPAVPPLDTPKPRRSALVFGTAIVIIVALLALLMWTLQQKGAPPLAAGQAPAFELTSFEGKTYRLSELRGTPVVINFWASWCTQCKDEARELEAIWKQYKGQGLLVLGVDYVDTEPEAKAYMAQFGITFPNGPDLGTKISKAYRITGVPETYFIKGDGTLLTGSDATGRPFGNWIGPIPLSNMQERVRKLMGL